MLFVLIHILPGLLVKHAENVERLQSVILAKAQMIQIIPRQDLVLIEQVLKTNLLRLLLLNVLKKQQLSSVFLQNWWLERWMDPAPFILIACERYFPHRWWAFIPAALQINAKLLLLSNPQAAHVVSRWIQCDIKMAKE